MSLERYLFAKPTKSGIVAVKKIASLLYLVVNCSIALMQGAKYLIGNVCISSNTITLSAMLCNLRNLLRLLE